MTRWKAIAEIIIRPVALLLVGYAIELVLLGTIVGYVMLIQLKPSVDATTFALSAEQQVRPSFSADVGQAPSETAGFPTMTVHPLFLGMSPPASGPVPVASLDLSRGANVTGILLDPAAVAGVVKRLGGHVATGDDQCTGVWLDSNAADVVGASQGDTVVVSLPAVADGGDPMAVTVCGALDAYADLDNPQPQHGLAVVRNEAVWQSWAAPRQNDSLLQLVDSHGSAALSPTHAMTSVSAARWLAIGGAAFFGVTGWLLLVARTATAVLDRSAAHRDLLRWWPVSEREVRTAVVTPILGMICVCGVLAAWIAGRPALLLSLGTAASLPSMAVLGIVLVAFAVPIVILTVRRRSLPTPDCEEK